LERAVNQQAADPISFCYDTAAKVLARKNARQVTVQAKGTKVALKELR
jgi:hypothetical protein